MDLTDLQEAVADAADDLALVAPAVGTKGKAYEVWIALEIAVRLLRLGYAVQANDPADIEVAVFRVRGSPGGMSSADATGDDNPSHFRIAGRWRAVELHIGLQIEGVSGARHEIDVTLLPADAATAYSDTSKLDQVYPRALLGVAADVEPGWLFPTQVLLTFGGAGSSRSMSTRSVIGLLTSTQLYDNSRRMMEHHGVLPGDSVRPGGDDAVLDGIVGRLREHLGPHPGWPGPTPRARPPFASAP